MPRGGLYPYGRIPAFLPKNGTIFGVLRRSVVGMSHVQEVYGEQRRLVLTSEQVAEMLEVSPRTVARLVKRGELPVLHIGRLPRFRPADVEAFLDRSMNDDGPGASRADRHKLASGVATNEE